MANQAAGDLTIACGGAVPTMASARSRGAMGVGANSPKTFHPRDESCDEDLSPGTCARSVQLALCQRFSRLCELMNPCPAGLEVHPDLAG